MGSALPQLGVPSGAATYTAALEGLTRLNETLMQRRPLPALYGAGVRYSIRPTRTWRNAGEVAREGWGDCEALSGYRAAELRLSGEDPDARIVTYQTGPRRFHAVVERGNGTIEDPSVRLGMQVRDPQQYRSKIVAAFDPPCIMGAGGVVERADCVFGVDPTPEYRTVSFDVYKVPGGGWSGVFRVPLEGGSAAFFRPSSEPGQTQATATAKLANLAQLAASNPELAKLIPPEAAPAMAVLTNPAVVKALKNPASLLNMNAALARPDIAVQNVAKAASFVKKLFG